jgi:hypothetical protein
MSLGMAFWVIWIVALVFGFWAGWGNGRQLGGNLVVLVLLGLLGWAVFGQAIHR